MKTYRNRFASMEQQPCGGWIVFNEVIGVPLNAEGHSCEGNPRDSRPKIHPTYQSAREVMVMLYNRYRSFERGRV